VFLVPFLNLALGLSFKEAVATSLLTVIATSSAVSARSAGKQLINLRLGMLLEVATAIGGLAGALTMHLISEGTLQLLFAFVTASISLVMLGRLDRRNVILDAAADPGPLGGQYHERESGGLVTYRVKRLPLALGASVIAGNISSFLGIGGGILKVPVLNAWCGVPLRAAAATSALMIGVTAVVIVVWRRSHDGGRLAATAFALILGGAIGNLIDRLRFGYVIDFLLLHVGGWTLFVFNLADAALTLGPALLLIVYMWPAPRAV